MATSAEAAAPSVPPSGVADANPPPPAQPMSGAASGNPSPSVPLTGAAANTNPPPPVLPTGGAANANPPPSLPLTGGAANANPPPSQPPTGCAANANTPPTQPPTGGAVNANPPPSQPPTGGAVNANSLPSQPSTGCAANANPPPSQPLTGGAANDNPPPSQPPTGCAVNASANPPPLLPPTGGAVNADAPTRLTEEMVFLSLVLRIIFVVSPGVVTTSICTPLLAIIYYASKMSFLAGDFRGGSQACVGRCLRSMFSKPPSANSSDASSLREGWIQLCRLFNLCSRGLYLCGRRKRCHFVGQPDSVPAAMEKRFNEKAPEQPQYLTRRAYLRTKLDLWVVESSPGSLTAVELATLRRLLLSDEAKKLATAAKCRVIGGLDPNGAATDAAWLLFNWGLPWLPTGESEMLVTSLKSRLHKAPNNFMTKVSDWPRDPVAAPVADTAAVSAAASKKRRVTGAAAMGGSARRSKHIKHAAEAFAPAALPAALASVDGHFVSDVHVSAAWPLGGWGVMLPLTSFLDASVEGKVDLNVQLRERARTDGDLGPFCYTLRVMQVSVSKVPVDDPVAARVLAGGGISSRACNVDFMKAVDEMSAAVLRDPMRRKSARTVLANAAPAASSPGAADHGDLVDEDATDKDDGGEYVGVDEPGSEPVGGGLDNAKSASRESLNALPSMTMTWAPPVPATPFSWSWTFSSSLQLSLSVADKWRRPGRLYIVVPVAVPVMDLI